MMPQKMKGVRVDAEGFNHRPVSVMSDRQILRVRIDAADQRLHRAAFVWMFLSSVKDNNEIFVVPVQWFPKTWHWEHYLQIWSKADMWRWLLNTLFFAVVVTFLQVFTGSFAAYGFSKIDFPGRNTLFPIYVATMAVPWQTYTIPQFKMLSLAGLNDTRWSIILLQAFGAFGVFMMKQFYDTIPNELSEAARLDGMSEFGIYLRIMLPLSGPSIAALSIITFTNTWNDYMGPLLYLRSPELYTIQLGLKTFISQYDADYAIYHDRFGAVRAADPHRVPAGAEAVHRRHRHLRNERVGHERSHFTRRRLFFTVEGVFPHRGCGVCDARIVGLRTDGMRFSAGGLFSAVSRGGNMSMAVRRACVVRSRYRRRVRDIPRPPRSASVALCRDGIWGGEGVLLIRRNRS